jgi:kynureninase
MDRRTAERLDLDDPLAGLRAEFDIAGDRPVYMDGNSLGRPSRATVEAVHRAAADWAGRLVGGWQEWIDLPSVVGDRLGRLVGAGPGQVLVCDSTTVNLYKLAAAALDARPGRDVIVGAATDFPTDRYVLEGLAAATGRRLVLLDAPDDDPAALEDRLAATVGDQTALVSLSHVHYRSGARLDGRSVTELVQGRGALMLWDLAHSAGSVPVDLDGWGADLAVGCSYKYLNGGPGAPGWLYVRRGLHGRLRQPIWGWFGRADQFAMGEGYVPAAGIGSHLTGTPPVIGLRAVDAGLELLERAGVAALWAKSQRLTALLAEMVEEDLVPLGARLASPSDPDRRGAHLTVGHTGAWTWCRALVDGDLVIPDFRAPDRIRLGPAPLYTRFTDCFDAVRMMAEVLAAGPAPAGGPARVT